MCHRWILIRCTTSLDCTIAPAWLIAHDMSPIIFLVIKKELHFWHSNSNLIVGNNSETVFLCGHGTTKLTWLLMRLAFGHMHQYASIPRSGQSRHILLFISIVCYTAVSYAMTLTCSFFPQKTQKKCAFFYIWRINKV